MTIAGVLVVDDEEAVRITAAEILRSEGYEVIEASDGEAALELLHRHPVSVIVLDVKMPKRDGIAVLDALEAPPPVVLMSAYSLDAETKSRLSAKVGAFLKKPFPPLRLLEEVSTAARRAPSDRAFDSASEEPHGGPRNPREGS